MTVCSSLVNNEQEYIDDYMAKGKGNPETNGDEPDPEDMGINEDAQTQQDFEQFKAWLNQTFGPAANLNRASSSASLSASSDDGSTKGENPPASVDSNPVITRKPPLETATKSTSAGSVKLCGSCGKPLCN